MAVTYGFFNSINGDRKYNADQMSDYFRGIVNEGVFQHLNGGLAVVAGTGMEVTVATGRAIVQNKWVQNDAAFPLTIEAASDTYGRKDAVVIRLSYTNRNISIVVKTGTPAASPTAPSMTRNSTTYEMALAYVNVSAGATSVTVTDKRSDTTVCGWATVAQQTSGEVDAMLNDMKTGFDGVVYNSPAAMVQGCDTKLQTQITANKTTFSDLGWFVTNGLKTQILFTIDQVKVGDHIRFKYLRNAGNGITYVRCYNSSDQNIGTYAVCNNVSEDTEMAADFVIASTFAYAKFEATTDAIPGKFIYLLDDNSILGNSNTLWNTQGSCVEQINSNFDCLKDILILDQNYKYYRIIYFWHNTHNYDLYIRIEGSNDNSAWSIVADYSRATRPSNTPDIEYITHAKFVALIDWRFAQETIDVQVANMIKPTKYLNIIVPYMEKYIDANCVKNEYLLTPHDDKLNAIKAAIVNDTSYSQYMIEYVWFNANGYNYYFRLSGSNNGTSWTMITNLVRSTAPSKYPEYEWIGNSTFQLLIHWSEFPSTVDLYSRIINKNPEYIETAIGLDKIACGSDVFDGAYAIKDNTANVIHVDALGGGDYTTITDACAAVVNPTFNNQYEIIVRPGRYNENNIIVPPFTHIHGLRPTTVVVTSEGFTGTQPVFDQRDGSSKLSNMHIISHTG